MTDDLPSEDSSVPARASATIMLVRDTTDGLEIYMVVRDRPMDGAMGAVVFPGGKVDAEDDPSAWQGIGLRPPQGHPDLPFWLAALRETFEEAGIVVARAHDADSGEIGQDLARRIVETHRERLLDRKITFGEILRAERLAPALDHMVHFAHWQTPLGLPKRFDTHFFLVAAPAGQEPRHDGREMVDGFWIRPERLLEAARRKERTLVAPTRLNLELLAESRTVAEAMARARQRRIIRVRPERSRAASGEWVISIPADAGYRTSILSSTRQN
jgi:8-oxo-dGTP pyrophosphatase MutT (NUDIX family)